MTVEALCGLSASARRRAHSDTRLVESVPQSRDALRAYSDRLDSYRRLHAPSAPKLHPIGAALAGDVTTVPLSPVSHIHLTEHVSYALDSRVPAGHDTLLVLGTQAWGSRVVMCASARWYVRPWGLGRV